MAHANVVRGRPNVRPPTIAPIASLAYNDESNNIIADYVTGILESIEAEVQTALTMQCATVRIDLPNAISAPPKSAKDAIREVYFQVIRELETKGYSPQLDITDDGAAVIVTVTSTSELRQREAMDQYLQRFTIRR